MSELKIYHATKDLPLPLYYQVETFVRIEWTDDEDYDIDEGLDEPNIHIVLSEGNTLFSYASVIWVDIVHNEISYKCYGLRSVFTFSASRRQGFGGQVVKAATDLIQQKEDADIALLWTEAHLVDYYVRYGWRAMPDTTILIGEPDEPEIFNEEIPMMLFVSDKGRAGISAIESGQLYVGDEPW
ncbi:MAG: GNAT family N-acetyltransferase [Chloroflexota bacterium]